MSREIYTNLRDHFDSSYESDSDVEVAKGKGAQGIKYKGKMFAMFSKGDLLLKSTEEHIQSLISEGSVEEYTVGGKTMKNMGLVRATKVESWIQLSEDVLTKIRK
jgi:TfoX/Sxy family transcriptional regulator of competence genes